MDSLDITLAGLKRWLLVAAALAVAAMAVLAGPLAAVLLVPLLAMAFLLLAPLLGAVLGPIMALLAALGEKPRPRRRSRLP